MNPLLIDFAPTFTKIPWQLKNKSPSKIFTPGKSWQIFKTFEKHLYLLSYADDVVLLALTQVALQRPRPSQSPLWESSWDQLWKEILRSVIIAFAIDGH